MRLASTSHSKQPVGEDEELEAVYEREEVKGGGVLKKAGTELVKYHHMDQNSSNKSCVCCMLFMPTDLLGNRAVHSYQQSVKLCFSLSF